MNIIIENFAQEKSWQDFIKKYKNTSKTADLSKKDRRASTVDSIVSDEDVWPFIISAFFSTFNFPLFILTATTERAGELLRELKSLNQGASVLMYPGIGNTIYSGQRTVTDEVISARLKVFKSITEYNKHKDQPFIIISTVNAIIDLFPENTVDFKNVLSIDQGELRDREELLENLSGMGYERVNRIFDRGEFSARGDIIDVFDFSMDEPFRIDLSGDKIENIKTYNIHSQQYGSSLSSITIYPAIEFSIDDGVYEYNASDSSQDTRMISIVDFLEEKIPDSGFIVCDPLEAKLKLKSDIDIIHKSFELKASDQKNDFTGGGATTKKPYKDLLIRQDFFDSENFKKTGYALNLMSSGFALEEENIFIFKELKKQKKILGNSKIFIDHLRKDISKRRIPIISLKSSDRIKKITYTLLNNNISFENHKSSENTVFKDLKPGVVHIFNFELFSGYESKGISIYGELDIYEQLDYETEYEIDLSGLSKGEFQQGDFVVHKTHGIGR
jgi:transcription-repair coupling factor (superfamily II helicase)